MERLLNFSEQIKLPMALGYRKNGEGRKREERMVNVEGIREREAEKADKRV